MSMNKYQDKKSWGSLADQPQEKGVLRSKTMQGIGGAATAPIIAEGIVSLLGLFGVVVSPEPVSKVVLLAGLAWAAYGRMKAEGKIRVGGNPLARG